MINDGVNIIRDEGNILANGTFIPNIIDDMALSVYAFRLYVRLKRRVNQNIDGSTRGTAKESTRSLAKTCGMSTGQVTKAKRELVEAGLISVKKITSIHGEYPHDEVTIIDIWDANKVYYSDGLVLEIPSTGEKFTGKEARAKVRGHKELRSKLPDFISTLSRD